MHSLSLEDMGDPHRTKSFLEAGSSSAGQKILLFLWNQKISMFTRFHHCAILRQFNLIHMKNKQFYLYCGLWVLTLLGTSVLEEHAASIF
jgi:hypothetical protein